MLYLRSKIITPFICILICFSANAQTIISEEETAIKSYTLYNAGKWKELLDFGKEAQAQGIQFNLLNMRIGYAAFMLGNYSQSLKQYQQVLNEDPENETALYYAYLNNAYLNNQVSSRYYASKLSKEKRNAEHIASIKLEGIQTEYSYKHTGIADRGNANYGRIGVSMNLGFHLNFEQSLAFYNQTISEPKLTAVTNNRNIAINQNEYYAKITAAASGKLSFTGVFHYLYTPFNNFIYNNTIFSAGVKYATPYVHMQAMGHFANIGDSAFNQVDATITTYPLGNTNLYTISRAAYGNDFTFAQIAGVKITKGFWLEGNLTLGTFQKLLEKDALYVYNDIDTKKFKAGGSIYTSLTKKLIGSVNYTFERKLRIFTTQDYFYQNSINGALSWNF